MELSDIPIADHICTVVDYINESGPSDTWIQSFDHMTRYLVACCWKKMHRRITHWSSQSFIYQLASFSDKDITDAFEAFVKKGSLQSSTKSDSSLGNQLEFYRRKGLLAEFMKLYRHPKYGPVPMQDPSGFECLIHGLRKEGTEYTLDMCLWFHRFLVITLCQYGQSLARCFDASKKKPVPDRNTMMLEVEAIYAKVQLIWRTSYSSFLLFHL